MPSLTLIRSAAVSRIVRAVNGSSSALPPNPRLTSSTPAAPAATTGQIPVGLVALEPRLIELPWCSQTRALVRSIGATGAVLRKAISSVVSLCGSQSSIALLPGPRSAKRNVLLAPASVVTAPVARSMETMVPPVALTCRASRPSTRRS